VTEILNRARIVALFALVGIAACTGDAADAKTGTPAGAAKRSVTQSPTVSLDLGGMAYTPATAAFTPSTVSGTVKLEGVNTPAPVQITADQQVCGTPQALALATSNARPLGFSNTVVWIADVKTGKPLPIDKRQELSSEKCLLDPRIQAAVVGTTFNVFNDDKLLHRLVFLDAESHDTLTVMPFFNVGQIVASEHLAKKSGIVEIRCAQHPWTRAYIAVFDSPYHAMTDAEGRFKIDSLPAGTYRVMAWREGMTKPFAQQVQVAAGGEAKVELKLAAGQ
jgi:hypothetical protein